MYSWRVTKYNPVNRDSEGSYLHSEEWTCFSEVGTKVSMKEYLSMEQKYIKAIRSFMSEMRLNKLYLHALEQWSEEVKNQHANEFLSKIWIGNALTIQEVEELTRLTLRNATWCKLGYNKQFYVHFGYDFYMYIGVFRECTNAIHEVTRSGLFVETYKSPY